MICRKNCLLGTNRRRYNCQQSGTKSALRLENTYTGRQVSCVSNGLHRVSVVRAYGEAFSTVVFDVLGDEVTKSGCLLGEPICRRSFLSRCVPFCHSQYAAPLRYARDIFDLGPRYTYRIRSVFEISFFFWAEILVH